jgi:hypothetical protein
MNEVLERRFASVGARLSLAEHPWRGAPRIDVLSDGAGEFFELRFDGTGAEAEVEVVDARPHDRHLLLLVRQGEVKSKFLCGHDERHWFVSAVPESARGVTGVVTAKAALQPDAVRALVQRVRPKDRFRRRNEAFIRQGEWFFVPATLSPEPTDAQVFRNEPLSRGRGKAHMLQFAFRTGGQTVYVNRPHPTGISAQRYAKLSPKAQREGQWMRMVRDPAVFAKGTVRHPDHATIQLPTWHRVLMNTEQRERAMQHVEFLD